MENTETTKMDILEQKIRISKILRNTLCGLNSGRKSYFQKIYRNFSVRSRMNKMIGRIFKKIQVSPYPFIYLFIHFFVFVFFERKICCISDASNWGRGRVVDTCPKANSCFPDKQWGKKFFKQKWEWPHAKIAQSFLISSN